MLDTPKQIIDLVERFERNTESYRSQTYNETQLRREFIDPLFEALGWDVTNKAGYAEAYKDVIHEDAIKVGSATKAPDYCFRIGGVRKFFLEAKKPSVGIKDDVSPAYQLRRYAWSAKLPLSILTDFEEFAVYDCRFPPKPDDKPSSCRILYLTYQDYASRWEEIASIFSKDAILRGSFDKFAISGKGKRGTSEVDAEFLNEIEQWRDALARNLALRNPNLTVRDLNFAVQRTIDRIIFLRMCEDRGVEPYGQLQALLNGENTYQRLRYIYGLADDRYNSGLFHFKPEKGRAEAPDELTLTLTIDDKVLKEDIIRRLYYPESPYEFSVLSADILGNVYEQFLGKVIRLTAGHRAVVDEKPEVKKAGGVYYTPAYIVDYIVKNTVGKLCEGKTPKQIAKLRILDPACGSGSFLIGAYTYLLDYHRNWHVDNDPKKHTKEIYQGAGGQWFLTTQEKKRILLSNIYGVDIDSQAVEVTKLSLLLKVLEGENKDTLERQFKMWRERALPDLGSNIKCGNSLIGPDLYANHQMNFLDEEQRYRINVFDWQAEFPQIMKAGGFDAVIGNPPYVNIENIPQIDRKYFVAIYGERGKLGKRYDIYQVFVLRGLFLLKDGGLLGFILPNTFLMGHSYAIMRERVCKHAAIRECVDLPQGVFKGVTVDNVLFFLQREWNSRKRATNEIMVNKLGPKSNKSRVGSKDWDETFCIPQRTLVTDNDFKLNVHSNPKQIELFCHMESVSVQLGSITESSQGIILYKTAKDAKCGEYTGTQQKKEWKRLLRGKNIGRYKIKWDGEFVHYGHWLWCARDEKFFAQPKILLQAMRNKSLNRRLVATYDTKQYYNAHNLANIIAKEGSFYDLKYILGLFNSELLNSWYKAHFPNVNINPNDFRQLPIRTINFDDPKEKATHDRLVKLVEQMLELHKRLKDARTPDEKTRLQRQIDATDGQIDRLVYELYGLTEEEIKIVEGETV